MPPTIVESVEAETAASNTNISTTSGASEAPLKQKRQLSLTHFFKPSASTLSPASTAEVSTPVADAVL